MTRAGLVGLALCAVIVASPSAQPGGGLRLETVSARPEFVSGGDVLVRVRVPDGAPVDAVRVLLNGTDVTASFRPDAPARTLLGLVAGLHDGVNELAASAPGRGASRVTLRNHPRVGPVFAGPHERPFICQTAQFRLPSGATLGAPLDEHCSIATRVEYYYRPAAGGALKPLEGVSAPADVAVVTTKAGARVPYIVRLETGTINRAIYQIAMLHDPASGPAPDPWRRSAGWNGRLIYTHGGGCVPGWYRQGTNTGGVVEDVMLRQGYAVASSSLNVSAANCGDLLASETLMMVKEHFIESFGAPQFTIGWGCSGGSYPQLLTADNYPGLLDGVVPCRTFPDMTLATVPTITDARLLNVYFARHAGLPFTDPQKQAIGGFLLLATMGEVDRDGAGRIHVTEHCPDVLPPARRFDRASNPAGVRCDAYDHGISAYGRDPRTGYAHRPLDNVGIQYGLAALNARVISVAQFLDLNEKIGGFDGDGNVVGTRTAADPVALRNAYRSGRFLHGGSGLAQVPIIDYRNYLDDDPEGNVHVRFQSFSLRERLRAANGHADNYVMLVEDDRHRGTLASPVYQEALAQMDRWLTGITSDTSPDPAILKIRRHKPADLTDACWSRDAAPVKIAEPQTRAPSSRCEALYPSASFPREVAGASIANDVMKCRLRPIRPADYGLPFSAAEMARLRAIFPAGVCDWSRPGVEQQKPASTWQRFGSGT